MHSSLVNLALVATAATAVVAAPNYPPWSSLSKESFTFEVPKPTFVTEIPFKESKSINPVVTKSIKSEFFTKSIITVVKPTVPVSFKPTFIESSGTESKTAVVYNRFFEPEPSFSVKTFPFFPFKTTIIVPSQPTSSPQSQSQGSNNGQSTRAASQSGGSNQSQSQSSNNGQPTRAASQSGGSNQSQSQSSNNGQPTRAAGQSGGSNQSQNPNSAVKTVTFKKPFFPFPTGFF